MLLPEPTYKGPESIVYFRGNTLQEELKRDTKVRHSPHEARVPGPDPHKFGLRDPDLHQFGLLDPEK
jgi:hypothetical protein